MVWGDIMNNLRFSDILVKKEINNMSTSLLSLQDHSDRKDQLRDEYFNLSISKNSLEIDAMEAVFLLQLLLAGNVLLAGAELPHHNGISILSY